MYKACSKCGKIHPANSKCSVGRTYRGGEERSLRASWDWTKKSREIREKADYLCEVCRDEGRYTHDHLEVHHIRKLSEYPDGLLEDLNLVCLCTEHHKEADDGKLNQVYLKKLALWRERKLPPGG